MVAPVNNAATLAGSLAGIAAGAVYAARLRRPAPYQTCGHAIAGPDDTDPLPGALRNGLGGLTVPVVAGPHGELFLGPNAPQPGRTLRRLILTPLFARYPQKADEIPFRLVVEFTGSGTSDPDLLLRAYRMLDQQLHDHAPKLSRCENGRIVSGAVTVSITGIVDVRDLLAEEPLRYVFAEGSFDDIGSHSAPPTLVPTISEPWNRRFGWDGRDPIPPEERHLLHALVRSAHDDGRTVRIGGLPRGSSRSRAAVWAELGAAGVDVIADTDHRGLARYLRRHPMAPVTAAVPPPTRAVRRTAPRPTAPKPQHRREPV